MRCTFRSTRCRAPRRGGHQEALAAPLPDWHLQAGVGTRAAGGRDLPGSLYLRPTRGLGTEHLVGSWWAVGL